LPLICTYPMCGKSLELIPAAARVQSKHCELEYCSPRCFKRDWRENNHPSVGTLLKRRREELAREEQARQVQKQRSWLDQLSDLIPEPQGLYRGELDKVYSSMSSQMEADAFTITARTFCQAYMAKFSMAVHGWSNDCYAASGRGAVVIHLSERALQQSFGAPLSYVSQRVVEILQDRNLSRMVQNYDPETQLVGRCVCIAFALCAGQRATCHFLRASSSPHSSILTPHSSLLTPHSTLPATHPFLGLTMCRWYTSSSAESTRSTWPLPFATRCTTRVLECVRKRLRTQSQGRAHAVAPAAKQAPTTSRKIARRRDSTRAGMEQKRQGRRARWRGSGRKKSVGLMRRGPG
jgi:hypothetical protein